MGMKNGLEIKEEQYSTFDGGMLAYFFIGFATFIVSIITLGLAYPAMVCWKLKWKASHTYLNGKKLAFDGKAMQLMGKYVLWMFLSVITLGLYYIFSAKLKLTEWETKHTHFAHYKYDENDNQSKFNGKWYQLFGVNFVCRFVTVITLFIGYYWAHCYKERWYCKHKMIDGCNLQFDGTGMQYFGKRIIWTLLTVVTFGIYSFWLKIKSVKWTISHTKLLNMPTEDNFMSVEEIDALPTPKLRSKEYKMSLSGFVISLICVILQVLNYAIIYYATKPSVSAVTLGIPRSVAVEASVIPRTGQTVIMCFSVFPLVIFTILGLVLCVCGYKKVVINKEKGKEFAVTGIVLSCVAMFFAIMTIMTFLSY